MEGIIGITGRAFQSHSLSLKSQTSSRTLCDSMEAGTCSRRDALLMCYALWTKARGGVSEGRPTLRDSVRGKLGTGISGAAEGWCCALSEGMLAL